MQLASSGGRRLRHAALAARKLALEAGRTVTRKELSAAARDAGKALALRPAQRVVLSELVACWGEQDWERLLVWPSNDYLMSRTGLTERAIRRILRQLIDLQLITPKDSPNGKRYAVKDLAGQVVDLQARTPTRSRVTLPADLLDAWQLLRTQAEEAFYHTGNEGLGVRHLKTNNESPSETCNKGFPKKA